MDFKRDQYAFSKATDEEKSELLKDILGFVNCWRRSEAFILIGVEEVRGGRSNVHGVSDHLDDHSLQQFINNLTNRPVQFGYEACEFEGQQVGIIRVELQRRPVYLKRDYGKLKKGLVYVRRGSSTDPTKPADPDEIAHMGSGQAVEAKEASLTVEFASTESEQSLGSLIDLSAEFCQMPTSEQIPTLDDTPAPIRLPGGETFQIPSSSSLDFYNRLNPDFFRELAEYVVFHKLLKKVRLVVLNAGESPATDVRLEICIPDGQGFGVVDLLEAPETPKRRTGLLVASAIENMRRQPLIRQAGDVDIDKNDHRTKIEIECGNLQPGRKVWTDAFYIGIGQAGEFKMTGNVFSANLSQPQEFTLAINADFIETTMTVDELVALGNSDEDEE
ncbi:MAG: ATP-binding protein [Candidatus Paceibacterota bacterium]